MSCFELYIDLEKMNKIVDRREHLCKHSPYCPQCDTEQVQLTEWILDGDARWKCRHCKHKFNFEPEKMK